MNTKGGGCTSGSPGGGRSGQSGHNGMQGMTPAEFAAIQSQPERERPTGKAKL